MSDPSSQGPNLAAQQQAMNHGKGHGGHALSIDAAFGRNAEAATALMHGGAPNHSDVKILDEAAKNFAKVFSGDPASSGGSGDSGGGSGNFSSHGRGGGADSVQLQNQGPRATDYYAELAAAHHRKDDKHGRSV